MLKLIVRKRAQAVVQGACSADEPVKVAELVVGGSHPRKERCRATGRYVMLGDPGLGRGLVASRSQSGQYALVTLDGCDCMNGSRDACPDNRGRPPKGFWVRRLGVEV
jgi:hypothetical protein